MWLVDPSAQTLEVYSAANGAWLRSQIAQVMGYDAAHKIDVRRGFFEMGMDSLMVVELRNRIQFSLGQSISSTVIFDHATTVTSRPGLATAALPNGTRCSPSGTSPASR